MSRFNNTLVLSSILLLTCAAPAFADPSEEYCDPDKRAKECPDKAFSVLELPGDTQVQQLRAGQAFLMHHECRAAQGALQCSGWPQEEKSLGRLRYHWLFESNGRSFESTAEAGPSQAVKCDNGSDVKVTLTVSNGKYQASSSDSFRCGKY
jgi:hypothetical protein